MPLIKFGGGITDMRGSMAGNVYSRNRYGSYMRARTIPTNPNTARQQLVRSTLALLTVRWSQTLPAAARDSWNLYGASVVMTNKLGEAMNLTGFNHYIRSNLIRVMRGAAAKDNGPVIFEIPDADPTLAVTGSEATQQFSITYDAGLAWDTETDGYLWVFQGSPQNAQRNFFGGPWRFMGQVDGIDGAPVASPLAADAVFPIAEGQRNWIYARIGMADGRLSEPFRADAFIAA